MVCHNTKNKEKIVRDNRISIWIGLSILVISVFFLACSKKTTKEDAGKTEEGQTAPLKVVFIANGNLGDLSFLDSANNGLTLLKEKYGSQVETKTIEAGYDITKWLSALEDLSAQDWDVIIVGTFDMVNYLEQVAPEHPEKNYILFDGSVDYTSGKFGNVYSMRFRQNEASFLAGFLAAKLTGLSDNPIVNPDKKIGFMGGRELPVTNDFLVGYIEGARYADPEVKMQLAYVGSWDDAAKGKEIALVQYQQGVDVSFQVAGGAGLGLLDAAKETNKYAIGVDSDQAQLFSVSDPEKSKLIVTSVLKRIDNSIVRAIGRHLEGTLSYGQAESLGFTDDAVGLVEDDNYRRILPQQIRQEIGEVKSKIASGEIKVDTAFGMSDEKLADLKHTVQ